MSNVRPRRFGTIGHTRFGSGGLDAMVALMLALHSKPTARRMPTPEEIAEQDKRTERERWNDAVDERRRAKQIAKKGYAK